MLYDTHLCREKMFCGTNAAPVALGVACLQEVLILSQFSLIKFFFFLYRYLLNISGLCTPQWNVIRLRLSRVRLRCAGWAKNQARSARLSRDKHDRVCDP